jgi:PD-(D/E)XK nuclease superfamily
MNVVTMRARQPRGFSWSWSKLNNFETCPRRHHHYDILKDIEQPETEELKDGHDLHKAMAKRVLNNTPLPAEYEFMEGWAISLSGVIHPNQVIKCELQLAIDQGIQPVDWFSPKAWYRGIVDYLRMVPSLSKPDVWLAHAVDYKTGKRITEGYVQLALNSQLIFAHYPEVQHIRTDYLWTKHNDTTHETFSRDDMQNVWADVLPRVEELRIADETKNFPPTPNGLCKDYCAVASCEHYGKRPNRRTESYAD